MEDICRDIDDFFQIFRFCFSMGIQGGESFVYPDLGTILNHLAKYRRQYLRLTIITNGTIIPDQATLDAVKSSKGIVSISNYGAYSRKLVELETVLTKNRIPFVTVKTIWKVFHIPSPKSPALAEKNWRYCERYHSCRQVKDGKLFYCPFLANGEALGVFPYSDANGVSLRTNRDEVVKYLLRKDYYPGCEYCGGDGRNVSPGEPQCKKALEYIKFS